MIRQEDLLQQAPFEDQEETQEVEEDFPMEAGDHQEGDHREGDHREGDHREGDHREGDHREGDHREEDNREEATTTITIEGDQTSWWETLQKYSKEYERKLSLSLLFGGSTQALTAKIPPSPMRTRGASYSSRIFKETMWQSGSNR